MTDGSATRRALSLICVVLLAACATGSFHQHGGAWRHCGSDVVVPDLTEEGWKRLRLGGTQLAFSKNGQGVIAVRVVCNGSARPLRWAGRDLWLGIPREGLVVVQREVRGRAAVETTARTEGAAVHTVVVEDEPCLVDFAHVQPEGSLDPTILDRFLERVRFGEER